MPEALDPVEPYGATIGDVGAFLPHKVISPTSKPSDAQVRQFLVITTNRVVGRLGELAGYPQPVQDATVMAAAGVAAMGAAGLTENAAAPERGGRSGTAYGDWLWAEFLKGIDELLEELGKATEVAGEDVVPAVAAAPAGSFPDPLWRRDTGF